MKHLPNKVDENKVSKVCKKDVLLYLFNNPKLMILYNMNPKTIHEVNYIIYFINVILGNNKLGIYML